MKKIIILFLMSLIPSVLLASFLLLSPPTPVNSFSEVHSGDFNGSTSIADGGDAAGLNINGGTSGGLPFSISGWVYDTGDTSLFPELVTKRDIVGIRNWDFFWKLRNRPGRSKRGHEQNRTDLERRNSNHQCLVFLGLDYRWLGNRIWRKLLCLRLWQLHRSKWTRRIRRPNWKHCQYNHHGPFPNWGQK